MERQREVWIDNVKVIACILVVLGHFFQSMIQADVLPANNLYQWFEQTIYYFHVPLFFICSGYLYQRWSVVDNLHSWGRYVLKKLLVLGIPYFTFSFATWILKTLFSSSINREIGRLGDTLFFHPTSPYWYLYALFLLFVITPTFRNRTMAMISLTIALIFKILEIFGWEDGVQAVSYILSNEIWFVIGMCLSVLKFKKYLAKKDLAMSIVTGLLFLFLSIWVYIARLDHGMIRFLMGLLACCSIVTLMEKIYENKSQSVVFGILAKYTMPIFLMHTLFAAALRVMLFKLGIQKAEIHVILGLVISFVGPMIAAIIMERSKWMEIFLYPGKFIKTFMYTITITFWE